MRKLKTYNTLIGILIIVLLGYVIFLMTRDRAELFNRYEGVDVVMDGNRSDTIEFDDTILSMLPYLQDGNFLAIENDLSSSDNLINELLPYLNSDQVLTLNKAFELNLLEDTLNYYYETDPKLLAILPFQDNIYGVIIHTRCTAGGFCEETFIKVVQNGEIMDSHRVGGVQGDASGTSMRTFTIKDSLINIFEHNTGQMFPGEPYRRYKNTSMYSLTIDYDTASIVEYITSDDAPSEFWQSQSEAFQEFIDSI